MNASTHLNQPPLVEESQSFGSDVTVEVIDRTGDAVPLDEFSRVGGMQDDFKKRATHACSSSSVVFVPAIMSHCKSKEVFYALCQTVVFVRKVGIELFALGLQEGDLSQKLLSLSGELGDIERMARQAIYDHESFLRSVEKSPDSRFTSLKKSEQQRHDG